jgi:hypothetical protein
MSDYINREITIKALRDAYEYEFPTASGGFDEYATKIVPNVINQIETKYHWVSVKDALPETNGKNDHEYDVLCYVPPREGCHQNGLYLGKLRKVKADEKGKHNFFGVSTPGSDWTLWNWSYFEEPIVTHWMPLPEAPKKE